MNNSYIQGLDCLKKESFDIMCNSLIDTNTKYSTSTSINNINEVNDLKNKIEFLLQKFEIIENTKEKDKKNDKEENIEKKNSIKSKSDKTNNNVNIYISKFFIYK